MTRILDIIFALTALFTLSPLLTLAAVALRLTGEGEILFKQRRIGAGGESFFLYKFATMVKNSPSMSAGTVTLKDDPRILPLGGFLRRTKINELPQLFNILVGDMSVIGPRPQTPRCFEAFPTSSQEKIIKTRPGLSGIGSIVFRNEEEMLDSSNDPQRFYDEVIMAYKGRLEEWYVDNQSITLYLQCIWLTFRVVLSPTSPLIWRVFHDLPAPPQALAKQVNWPLHYD